MKTLADKKMIAPVNSKGHYKDVLKVSDVKATIERIKECIKKWVYISKRERDFLLEIINEEVGEL